MNESNNAKNDSSPLSTTTTDIRVDVFGRTDVGLVREHNEDNFLIADLTAGNRNIKPEVRRHAIGEKGSIFIVCDGMGGAAAGEVASQIAVDTIYDMMQKSDPPKGEEALAQRLEKAISEAGRRILSAAHQNRSQRGMGTTVTAAALMDERLLVGQVGDSRAYILRGRQFVQITKDQSLVQQLIDAKQMTEEEARSFDKNNIILQALGTAEEVHVDMTSVVLKTGDRLVICSDGLCGLVENEAIGRIVYDAANPLEACRVLTEQACEAGGYDNITVIVASFDGESLDSPLPEDQIDETLIYDRYAFSRESETTSRKMRPKREPENEENDEIGAFENEFEENEYYDQPLAREDTSGVNKPLLGAVATILVIIVVIFVYMYVMGRENEQAVTPQETAPVLTEPVPAIPDQQPSPPAVKQNPLPASQPEPPPIAQPVAPIVPDPPQNADAITEPEQEEPAPALAPTPEEAITKGEKPGGQNKRVQASKKKSNQKKSSAFHAPYSDQDDEQEPDSLEPEPNEEEKSAPSESKEKSKAAIPSLKPNPHNDEKGTGSSSDGVLQEDAPKEEDPLKEKSPIDDDPYG